MSGVVLKTLANQTVASAGTAEALSSTPVAALAVQVQALSGNTGAVYVGDSDVASSRPGVSLSAGQVWSYSGEGNLFDLSEIYVDVETSGEGVSVIYFEKVNR
jgi:hypothetical protein